MTTTSNSSRTKRKIAAIAAGALVVGLGATYTLASWNDSEWVWGGVDGTDDPGVGTSDFNVQQNTTTPYDTAGWTDEASNPGGALTFTAGALSLTPGDTIYAPVALRTEPGSDPAETTLQAAVAADGVTVEDTGDALWDAIEVSVYTEDAAADTAATNTCDAANIGAWGTALAGISSLDDTAGAAQSLADDAQSTQHYCFELTLPETAGSELQGRTIAPAWEFASESN